MNILDQIYTTYLSINEFLQAEKSRGETAGGLAWSRKSEINNCAYFVLLFGEIEAFINREYEQVVGPWEDAAFTHRVNCLYRKDIAILERIVFYYELRCDIAHGRAKEGKPRGRVNIRRFHEDIQKIVAL